MKRISYLLAATLFVGCPGTETSDAGMDAPNIIDHEVGLRDTHAPDAPPLDAPMPLIDSPILGPDTAADAPSPCGELGALCCDGESCSEGVCLSTGPAAGRCEVEGCGTSGDPCCVAGSECRTGLACADGVCDNPTCGAPGQPCCGTDCDFTSDQYFCISGTCFDCGEVEEACCAGALPCLGSLSCVAGTCKTPVCGMPGMICCPGDVCSGAFECVRGEFSICTDTSACGHQGEACCSIGTGCVGSAPPGLECRFGVCGACGGPGQSCCSTGPGVASRCATGLSCGGGGICS